MYEEDPASDSSEVLIKGKELCAVGVPEAFGPIGT